MKHRILLSLLLLVPTMLWAEGDDFGTWTEIGVEKSLGNYWDFGIEGEFRSQAKMRAGLGVSLSYKPCKYIKLGAGYTFLESFKDEKTKLKDDEYDEFDYGADDPYVYLSKRGFNTYPSYWNKRHRISVDVSGSVKLWKWLRISVRERYQYTIRPKQKIDKFEHREKYEPMLDFDDNWEPVLSTQLEETTDEWDTKDVDHAEDHVLRSRLKLEVDKKKWKATPYISAEAHNSLNDKMLLEKVRTAIGFDYKISKHHSVGMSYILTFGIFDDEGDHARLHERTHALGIGYNYKF